MNKVLTVPPIDFLGNRNKSQSHETANTNSKPTTEETINRFDDEDSDSDSYTNRSNTYGGISDLDIEKYINTDNSDTEADNEDDDVSIINQPSSQNQPVTQQQSSMCPQTPIQQRWMIEIQNGQPVLVQPPESVQQQVLLTPVHQPVRQEKKEKPPFIQSIDDRTKKLSTEKKLELRKIARIARKVAHNTIIEQMDYNIADLLKTRPKSSYNDLLKQTITSTGKSLELEHEIVYLQNQILINNLMSQLRVLDAYASNPLVDQGNLEAAVQEIFDYFPTLFSNSTLYSYRAKTAGKTVKEIIQFLIDRLDQLNKSKYLPEPNCPVKLQFYRETPSTQEEQQQEQQQGVQVPIQPLQEPSAKVAKPKRQSKKDKKKE